MRSQQAKQAFTLIEIVVSIGVMGIAFLATGGAISTLLIKQDLAYNTTVAGSAASLLLSPDTSGCTPPLATLAGPDAFLRDLPLRIDWCTFRGGPDLADAFNTAAPGRWQAFIFNPGTAFGGMIDLRAYRSLVVTLHSPVTPTVDQQVWAKWYSFQSGVPLMDINDLQRVFPHYEFGQPVDNVPTTDPLYFGEAIFWQVSRADAESVAASHAAGVQVPLKLDFLGAYRYLHPAMPAWTPTP